ncbi:MAG: hypothetical protein ACKVPX_08840 [Myxococcaceae bacterium]
MVIRPAASNAVGGVPPTPPSGETKAVATKVQDRAVPPEAILALLDVDPMASALGSPRRRTLKVENVLHCGGENAYLELNLRFSLHTDDELKLSGSRDLYVHGKVQVASHDVAGRMARGNNRLGLATVVAKLLNGKLAEAQGKSENEDVLLARVLGGLAEPIGPRHPNFVPKPLVALPPRTTDSFLAGPVRVGDYFMNHHFRYANSAMLEARGEVLETGDWRTTGLVLQPSENAVDALRLLAQENVGILDKNTSCIVSLRELNRRLRGGERVDQFVVLKQNPTKDGARGALLHKMHNEAAGHGLSSKSQQLLAADRNLAEDLSDQLMRSGFRALNIEEFGHRP